MLRRNLIIYGVIHSSVMLGITVWASLENSILNAGYLFFEVWFLATLADTYLAFLLVYLWLAVTSRHLVFKVLCALSFILLGNIAMGLAISYRAYVLGPNLTWTRFFKGELND